MSRLAVLAETQKLARLLGVAPEKLDYLRALDAEQLRSLRERLSASLFDGTRPMFQRVALASKLLPNALVALIGEKIFGPMLCARVAGLLPPDSALDVALRLPDAFLADVSAELDPRSAHGVIARMPAKRVIAVAAVLIQRGDFVTMGRFVDYLPQAIIKATIDSIGDDAALLKTAFFVENKATLNQLVSLMPLPRIRAMVALAGQHSELWTEALALMSYVDDGWKRKIGDLAADQDEAVLTALVKTAQSQQLWDSLLPIVGCMSAASQQKLARLPAIANAEVLGSIVQAADDNQLWAQLLPLLSHMPEATRKTAAQIVEHLPQGVPDRLLEAANQLKLWPELLDIVSLMDADEKSHMAHLIGKQPDAVLGRLLEMVSERQLWPQLLPQAGLMEPQALQRLQALAARLGLHWGGPDQ